jgi:RND family efflux transporter MFP subunit
MINRFCIVLFIVSAAALLFCASCAEKAQLKPAEKRFETAGSAPPPVKQPLQVTAAAVEYEDYTPCIRGFGSLIYSAKIDITPQAGGTIQKIYVREGDTVRKGDLLAELQNLQLAIQLRQAEAAVSEAEAAVTLTRAAILEGKMQVEARLLQIEKAAVSIEIQQQKLYSIDEKCRQQEELYGIDGISLEELENTRLSRETGAAELKKMMYDRQIVEIGYRDRDLERFGSGAPVDAEDRLEKITELNTRTLAAEAAAAEARRNAAEKTLQSTRLLMGELEVTAPADAVIGARYFDPGERTTGKETLFTLFTGRRLFASFPVREEDSFLCKRGQEVTVTVPALENKELKGIIDSLSPTVDPSSGNVLVKASVPNTEGMLKPGMFIRAAVRYGETRQSLFVPVSSVINPSEGAGTVYTVSGSKAFPRDVSLGAESGERIEVTSGLRPGMLIIENPPPLLQEGEYVEIVE